MRNIPNPKTMAKALRASLRQRQIDIPHSVALEIVAVQHGGSSALCVDHVGLTLTFVGDCRAAHRTAHEQALSHAGLPRRRYHAGQP